jgi:glycolate oxidase FAD binding subunit
MREVASPSHASTIAEFAEGARAIVSAENVRAATPQESVAGVQPQLVVAPSNEQELARVLQLANRAGLAVTPRGSGTKLAWGNPPKRADVVLSTARLNRIVEHAWADLTVTVEAGCTIQTLQNALALHGQRLALDALWHDRATVGGVLSTNDSGALRLRFGALRDLVIGITLALPDGTLAKSGGKVVKNVAGYDLPKLATGALGTLGVITRAVFRLHPAPKEPRTISFATRDFADAQRLLLAIQDSRLAHSALQVRSAESAAPHIDTLFEATEAGLAAQIEQLRAIFAPATVTESAADVWNARQAIFGNDESRASESAYAIAKLSVLPTQIADTLSKLASKCAGTVRWSAVIQATGLGCIRLQGAAERIVHILTDIRAGIELGGGSLGIAHRHAAIPTLDAWGATGDALPLMRAVKQQFDPAATLNPGRFVGGI